MVSAPLPNLNSLDVEALRALVMAQHVEIERQQELHQQAHSNYAEQYSAHVETLSAQRLEIERLQLLIAKLRRMVFGTKSEKVRVQLDQLELQLEELEAAQAAAETHVEPPAAKTRTSRRKPLPEHLTREVVNHLPEQTCCCPGCGGELHHFGEDVAEVLEYVPANFKVIRHVRPKFACKGCERVIEAAAPSRPIARGLAGPGLLAHVLVAKYADHLPLYRQSEMYAREGIDLDRSTLAGWVGAASELLSPLVAALRNHVLAGTKLHADDRGPRGQVFVRGVVTRLFRCFHPSDMNPSLGTPA